MDELSIRLYEFLHKTLEDVQEVDFETLLTEFEGQVHSSCLTRPIFPDDSSQVVDIFKPDAEPCNFPLTSSPVLSSTSQETQGGFISEPKHIGFIYPTKEEILAELLPERPRIIAERVQKPSNEEQQCLVKSTQEFEDSFAGISWTQVLAASDDLPTGNVISNPSLSTFSPASFVTRVAEPAPDIPTISEPVRPVFMTAGGMKITLPSRESLQKARRLFEDDLSVGSLKGQSLSGEGTSTLLEIQTHSQHENASPPTSAPPKDASEFSSNGEVVLSPRRQASANIPLSNDIRLTGFTSAKGTTLLLRTASSKEQARSLLSSELFSLVHEETANVKENSDPKVVRPASPTDAITSTDVKSINNRSSETMHSEFVSELDSYSIIRLPLSSIRLPPYSSCTGFTTASGTNLNPPSSESIERARRLFSTLEDTGTIQEVVETPKCLTTGNSPTSHFTLQRSPIIGDVSKLGSHVDIQEMVSIPKKTPDLPTSPLIEVKNQPRSSAVSTPVDVDETTAIRIEIDAVSTEKLPGDAIKRAIAGGFIKASGRKIDTVSSTALQRARQLVTSEIDAVGSGTTTTVPLLGTSAPKTEATKSGELSGPQKSLDTQPILSAGFVRASGRSVDSVSSTAVERARQFCAADPDDVAQNYNNTNTETVSTALCPNTPVSATVHDTPKPVVSETVDTLGFKSASGRKVVVSEETIKRARQFCQTEDIIEPLSSSGLMKVKQSLPGTPFDELGNSESIGTSPGSKTGLEADVAPTIAIHPPQEADFTMEPDSLTSLMEDSQFQTVMQSWLRNHDLEKTDPALESRRHQLRIEQRETIGKKLALSQLRHPKPSRSKIQPKESSQNPVGSLYCPGSLWRLRAACRQAYQQTSPDRSPLIPLKNILERSASPSEDRDEPGRVNSFYLPDTVHFPVDADRWCLRTAAQLRWRLDLMYILRSTEKPSLPASYEAGDGAILVPDAYGCVGKEEIISAFLASPNVCCQLASQGWLSNHYDQLVWKIGSTAMTCASYSSSQLPSDYFSPHHVLLRLKYRYDRELEQVERPALRKIIELDDTPARRLVLCVSEITACDSNRITVRVTDGWYQVNCQLDDALIRLIRSGRIRVGTKLVTANAELVHVDAATGASVAVRTVKCSAEDKQYGHLFGADGAAMGVSLRLHSNSTRPCPWHTCLGYAFEQPSSGCGLYPVPLCTLSPDGGLCSAIRVVVQRRFPLQYMETLDLPDSKAEVDAKLTGLRRHVFRSERAEQAEIAQFELQRRRALDKALDNLLPDGRGVARRKQPTQTQLTSLGTDGEALFTAVMSALDPAEAESMLNDAQRESIRQFKETAIRNAMDEVAQPRKVTPLLRVRVAGLHSKDVALNYVVPITFWNPTDDLLTMLKEGEPVEIYKLQASSTRCTDPFAPPSTNHTVPTMQRSALFSGATLALSGGRNTSVRPLLSSAKRPKAIRNGLSSDIVDADLIARVYQPRNALSVADVQRLCALNKSNFHAPQADQNAVVEVDLRCVVVIVHQSHGSTTPLRTKSAPKTVATSTSTGERPTTSEVDSVYVTDANAPSDGCLVVVKIWGGLQAHHLSNLLQKGQAVHFTDLQLRRRQQLPTVPILDPELGSKSFTLVSLNYTVASNVTADKVPARTQRSRLSTEKSCLSPHLERLAEMHWSSYSTPTTKRYPSSHLVDASLSAPTRTRIGVGLSALLQSAGKADATPIGKAVKQPVVITPTGTEQKMTEQQATPLRSLVTRSAPRTGLSRHTRRTPLVSRATDNPPTLSLKVNQPLNSTPVQNAHGTSDCIMESAVTPLPPDSTTAVLKQPLSVLLSEDQLLATPEPKLKRRRDKSSESLKLTSPKTEENKENLIESFGSILEDTFELPRSPTYAGDTPTCNPPSTPSSVRTRATEMSSPSFSGPDSSEDMDVSIADLVKTRRRSTRSFRASSTPSRTRLPRFPV